MLPVGPLHRAAFLGIRDVPAAKARRGFRLVHKPRRDHRRIDVGGCRKDDRTNKHLCPNGLEEQACCNYCHVTFSFWLNTGRAYTAASCGSHRRIGTRSTLRRLSTWISSCPFVDAMPQ